MKKIRIVLLGISLGASMLAIGQLPTSKVDVDLKIYNDVMRQLDMYYVDTLNYDKLLETSINQMLKQVDPYTTYFPKDKDQDLKLMTTGKYGGIGAMIMQRGDWVYVSDPYEGMPAQRNGLRAGDKILEIDGKSMKGKVTSEVSHSLRGTPHSVVNLKIEREGENKSIKVSFEREEIKLDPVDYYGILENTDIGFIAFGEFTEHSYESFKTALDILVKQKGAKSLIIDLRDNGGGLIDEAVKIMSLFVDKGTEIVSTRSTRNPDNARVYKTSFKPEYADMPLVILVNGQSASASEIVAGSMQDLDRATIIGSRTYGKGLVQNIRPIAYDGHLKLTTAKYYIPSGRCIQAIDYSRRREDGSVERMPDSLTNEFHTKLGRIVRDGGGIEPDIDTKDTTQKLDITYSLYTKHYFFDYANKFRREHESIAQPQEFIVTDSIIDDFCKFLEEKGYQYETETSKYCADLVRMAKMEDLDSTLIADITALQQRLTPNFRDVVWHQKEHIQLFLGSEIISRYYYQRGKEAYNVRFDSDIKRAIKELQK